MGFKDSLGKLKEYFLEEEEEVQLSQPQVAQRPKKVEPQAYNSQPVESRMPQQKVAQPQQTKKVIQSKISPKPDQKTTRTATFAKEKPRANVNQHVSMAATDPTLSTIAIKEPKVYADIMDVARILRNNESVLINFKHMDDYQARRSIDFFTGVVFTVDGDIQNVNGQIFLLTPPTVSVEAARELSVLAGQNFKEMDGYR